jgi:hypothetical protein
VEVLRYASITSINNGAKNVVEIKYVFMIKINIDV